MLIQPPPPVAFHMLPPALGLVVEEVARFTQTPRDLAIAPALGAVFALTQGRVEVEVEAGYVEPICGNVASVAGPGERKSAVVRLLKRPVVDIEARCLERERAQVAREAERRRVLEEELKACRAASARGKQATRDPLDVAAELEVLPPAAVTRYLVDDMTVEALARHLQEQGGTAAWLDAEGAVFGVGRRYTDEPNLDLLLKGHAGEPVSIRRASRDKPPIDLPRVVLSAGVMVQPDVVRRFASADSVRGRGLWARWIWIWPASAVGERLGQPAPLRQRYLDDYAAALEAIHDRPRELRRITLDADAQAVRLAFKDAVELRLRPGGELAELRDWGSKLAGAAVRFAGAFAVFSDPRAEVVDGDTMERAVAFAESLVPHAKRVAGELQLGADHEVAQRILDALRRRPPERDEVSQREIHRRVRGTYPKVSDILGGIEVLEGADVLEELPAEPTVGRPSRRFFIWWREAGERSPNHGQNGQNAQHAPASAAPQTMDSMDTTPSNPDGANTFTCNSVHSVQDSGRAL